MYDDNIVSIEPIATPDFEKETKGLPAVQQKIKKFLAMIDTSYSIEVSTPLISGNAIAFTLTMDVMMKDKPRKTMSEICVYEVKDG